MSTYSRLLFIVVLSMSTLAVFRLFSGPPIPRGATAIDNIDPYELTTQSFQVSGNLLVLIDAVGSVDDRRGANGLAAYSWITHISSGETVWSMLNSPNTVLDGSLATITQDSLTLERGEYRLNFASYGQLLKHSDASFEKDQRKWKTIVHSPNNKDALRSIDGFIEYRMDDQLWDATPLGREEKREHLFEVHSPVDLTIHAIGQLGDHDEVQPVDFSRIEDVVTGQVIWQLTRDNTSWAGGALENRVFKGQRLLPPSVYRAVVTTNSTHHYDDWLGNPPYHPDGWGLRLAASQREAVRTFDPWMLQRDPIIGFTQVGDDEEHFQSFTAQDTTAIVVDALGEITGPDNGYDLARLEQQDNEGEWEVLWEMSWEGSAHAGGSRKNRKEVQFFRLPPGRYTLSYESDGSHSFENWNSSEPDYPERWGVAMFSVMDGVSTVILDDSVQ
ncbi:MAG: hypothetical protein OXF08_07155 [Bacteroidetes bacterium]|nr:hypothetical protein [Bacteroidota bacterium]